MLTENADSRKYLINFNHIFLIGMLLTSFGILLVTVGGSWDITNHLLNKPETFFSPPHAMLYLGVGITLVGVTSSLIASRRVSSHKSNFIFPLRLMVIGIFLLLIAGPIDFFWHTTFGLDGLLSPPHLCLISGMVLSSIGAMIGYSRYMQVFSKNSTMFSLLQVLSILPIWLSVSGLFYSFSLPFSDTDFFKFNPDPNFAVVFATMAFPFLISFSLILVSRISNFKFGILSITGILFIIINWSTSIVPNLTLDNTHQFYFLTIIPIVCADILIWFYQKNSKIIYFVGGLLGSIYYFVYFPLITHTFNEVISKQLVWASLTSKIYFSLLTDVYLITFIPAIISGIIAAILSTKIANMISVKDTNLK